MKKEIKKTNTHNKKSDTKVSGKIPAYPVNPASEDIYRKSVEEQDVDPEDITKTKRPDETEKTVNADPDDFDAGIPTKEPVRKKRVGKRNEKDFEDDVSGDDLDVPGSELDERENTNGNEDEENDYYSLGGDDHNDLDEDRGE
jgi:hypothetical protein